MSRGKKIPSRLLLVFSGVDRHNDYNLEKRRFDNPICFTDLRADDYGAAFTMSLHDRTTECYMLVFDELTDDIRRTMSERSEREIWWYNT